MENCLITKLKASVANDNLEYLEYLHINVKQEESVDTDDFSIKVTTSPASNLYIDGNGYFTDGTLTEDRGKIAPTGYNQKFSNGNYVLKLPLLGISELTSGSAALGNITKWQNRGLNYSRLCELNKDTLTRITFDDPEIMIECANNMVNVTYFCLICYQAHNITPILDAIVESDGRTANFKFEGNHIMDTYGTSYSVVRNVHVISNTQYSVYDMTDTQLLYTAQKVNGVWTHTLA